MRFVAFVAFLGAALAVAGTAAPQADGRTTASLRLASLDPIVVRGAGFRVHELVRLELSGAASGRRRTVASRSGSFTARFEGATATRCDVVRVVAVGSRGSRAVLKYLPSPACLPA